MRVAVIGATGTIGSAVAEALEPRHDVVRASRRGASAVDLDDPASFDALIDSRRDLDAVVCCAASTGLAPFTSLSASEFARSASSKLFGQVALARWAFGSLSDEGSITLTSGTFAEPIAGSSAGALVNAGLEGFVRALAVELPRGLRINTVSPGWVTESLVGAGLDASHGTPAAEVARAYVEAVEGTDRGQTIRPAAANGERQHS